MGRNALRLQRMVEDLLFDTSYTLQVADNGFGIPSSEQHRLFERFFRSSTASANNVPGTGPGLTIAKTIIENHGGSLSCDSTVGKGTTFTISLPKRSAPV